MSFPVPATPIREVIRSAYRIVLSPMLKIQNPVRGTVPWIVAVVSTCTLSEEAHHVSGIRTNSESLKDPSHTVWQFDNASVSQCTVAHAMVSL